MLGRKSAFRIICVVIGCWLLSLGTCSLFGQGTLPDSAQVDLYFPQFADGGPVSGQWQTIFTFSNPNTTAISLTLYLLGNNGQPLQMDFGTGMASQFSLSVP